MSKRFRVVLIHLPMDNELATRNHRLLRLNAKGWGAWKSCSFRPSASVRQSVDYPAWTPRYAGHDAADAAAYARITEMLKVVHGGGLYGGLHGVPINYASVDSDTIAEILRRYRARNGL